LKWAVRLYTYHAEFHFAKDVTPNVLDDLSSPFLAEDIILASAVWNKHLRHLAYFPFFHALFLSFWVLSGIHPPIMPAPTAFLAPHPPNLFHVTESQAFSGSSASFSSTSSATSAFFDRLSRASSASAYLTDLTPPITPSHSNFDVERRHGIQQSKPPNDGPVSQQESTPKDSRHQLVRSILRLDEDGYGSDDELEGEGFDAVDTLRTRLRRSKQTINSRRALKVMERRDTLLSPIEKDDDNEVMETVSPPMKVVITEAQRNSVEDWSGDFELTAHQDSQVRVA
jgi:hypothetical protein